MSRRARQLNREVAETPLWSDNKVVNVASSMVTTPPMRSGPCSGMRGASKRCSWAKSTSGAWSSGTEAVEAKRMADWVLAGRASVSRRRWVTGSTSKTVSPAAQGTGVSGVGFGGGTGCRGEEFRGHSLRPDPAGFGHTRSQGRRRAGRAHSDRCPTRRRGGLLRRGGGRRFG